MRVGVFNHFVFIGGHIFYFFNLINQSIFVGTI